MISYKTSEEIELIRESAQLVSKTLGELNSYIVPGTLPINLDKVAKTFIRDHGAIPGFLGLYDFPNSLCISVNEQVVHGIPRFYVARNMGSKLLQPDFIYHDHIILENVKLFF